MMKGILTEMDDLTREAYQDYLSKWSFEWMITIRLPSQDYCSRLKTLRNTFLRVEHGQIGYAGIFVNGHTGPHVHIAMLGRFPGDRTLKDIDADKWKKKIDEIVKDKKGGKIEQIYDVSGAAKYIFKKDNTPAGKFEFIEPWGRIITRQKH